MARTATEIDRVFPLAGPTMDASTPPSNLEWGSFHRLYGVDGRFTNSLRIFPGFVSTGISGDWGTGDGLTLDNAEATPYPEVFYYEYLTEGGNRSSHAGIRAGQSGFGAPYSFTSYKDHIYKFRQGSDPMYGYREEPSNTIAKMGPEGWYPSDLSNVAVSSVTTATTGGFLEYRGKYNYAFRWKSTTTGRNLATGMSKQLSLTVAADTGSTHLATVTFLANTNDAYYAPATVYDTLEVWRTINLRLPGDLTNSGVLYLEKTITNPVLSDQTTTVTLGTLQDEVLVQQTRYDPWNEPTLEPEQTGAGIYYKGIMFLGRENQSGFVWSSTTVDNLETFVETNVYEGSGQDGAVWRFIPSGDYLFAFTPRVAYRIAVVGGSIGVDRCMEGVVPVNRYCVTSANGDLFILTSQGISYVNSASLESKQLTSVNSIIFGDWADSGDDEGYYTCAYDSKYSCVIFNKYRQSKGLEALRGMSEAIVLWLTTGKITLLKDMPFQSVVTVPSSNFTRAVFISVDPGELIDVITTTTTTSTTSTTTPYPAAYSYYSTGSYVIGDGDIDMYETVLPTTGKVLLTPGTTQGEAETAFLYRQIVFYDDTNEHVYYRGFCTAVALSTISGELYATLTTKIEEDSEATYNYTRCQVGGVFGQAIMPAFRGGYNPNFSRVLLKSCQIGAYLYPHPRTEAAKDNTTMVEVGVYRNGEQLDTTASIILTSDYTENVGLLQVDGTYLYPYLNFYGSGQDPIELSNIMFTLVGNFSENAAANDSE